MVKIKKIIRKKVRNKILKPKNKTEKLRKLLDLHHHNKFHKAKDKAKYFVKKNLFKPLKFSRLTLIILGIILCIFILFLTLNFIISFNLNNQLRQDLVKLENKTNTKIKAIANLINPPASVPISELNSATETQNSFGDHFSGLAFINQEKTTMKWDELVTSFSFPPLYSFEKVEGGTGEIFKSQATPRLTVSRNSLYYRGRKISLPVDLKVENILNINVDLIGSTWLIGIVTGKTYDERVWVYAYDGKKFEPIVTKLTEIKIEPKFERLGGQVAFGGTEKDLLIVYGSYDGHILHYFDGTMTDVSDFFGLRVSAGGFRPQISSHSNSRGTVFYICSQTEGRPKLIKIWPKGEGELMGAIDFSPLIFTDSFGVKSASCRIEDANSMGSAIKILVDVKKNDGSLETWRFIDNGFDNSSDREVVSTDIGQNRGRLIISAAILALDVSGDGLINNDFDDGPNQNAAVFLSNQENNWWKIKRSEWINFNEASTSLFWRATFKAEPGNQDYSPWFSHINQLEYKTR